MRAIHAYGIMNDTLKNVRDSIKHRRALYRSLQRRDLIQGDPSLRSLDGSVYAQLGEVYQSGLDTMSPVELAHICERCYAICNEVYNEESGLTAPESWPGFLEMLKQVADDPDQYGHRLQQVLETALADFATELMALEYIY